MEKNKIAAIACGAAIAAAVFGSVTWFNAQADSYTDRFIEGTYINGRNVGGMTAEEVEESIRRDAEDFELKLRFADGEEEILSAEDMGYRYVSDNKVSELLGDQDKGSWMRGKLGHTETYEVGELCEFDEEKLRASIEALPEMNKDLMTPPSDAYMELGDDYRIHIVPEDDGSVIDLDKVTAAAADAIKNGGGEVDVAGCGAMSEASRKADDAKMVKRVHELNGYLGTTITCNMYDGSQEVLDGRLISTWMTKSKKNQFYKLTEEAIYDGCREFAEAMAAKYDYSHDSLEFMSSYRGGITFSTSPYGRIINTDAETGALYGAVTSHQSMTGEPVYSLKRDVDPTFGGTYIEVDIENQHVWYYENGEDMWESDCVTGLESSSSRRTPRGIFDIYYKERNRTLRGERDANGNPSYESFVSYWMPFYEGCGLHDATWRGSFGGNIYQYSGSHGCVNLPYSKAASLYEMAEVGTPVIVF